MHIIILAGGGGTRLWPFSRLDYPKQFLHFGDHYSLLQKTLLRCLKIHSAKKILVITNQQYLSLVEEQVDAIAHDTKKISFLVEPERKNTAPALCLGVKHLEEKFAVSPSEKILVLPSDHHISSEEEFGKMMDIIDEEHIDPNILVFGIRPTSPETGFGYLLKGPKLENTVYDKVESFVEKPDLGRAKEYLKCENYFWNSGMFCFSLKTFWEQIESYAAEFQIYRNQSYAQMIVEFGKMPSISIDHALMEKSQAIVMQHLSLEWSDVGSWDSVYQVLEKDPNANVKMGHVLDMETKNSLIFGGKRLISTIGLEDMLIVETADALFLAKKGKSQQVKDLVDKLLKKGHNTTSFSTENRAKELKTTKDYSLKIHTITPQTSEKFYVSGKNEELFEVLTGKGGIFDENQKKTQKRKNRVKIDVQKTIFIENLGQTSMEILHIVKQKTVELSTT